MNGCSDYLPRDWKEFLKWLVKAHAPRALDGIVYVDNLDTINRLTAGNAMTIVQAAWGTWTGMQANELGFVVAELVGTPKGTPGNYTEVHVVFK